MLWQIFLAHPWLGAGWHQFSAARWQLPSPVPIQLHADHAHNVVINLLAETGLLGFAAVCVP
ncbi:MAG: O-antigen ligase family protein, partial [Anaerolineae bacterium]|nr:O-antigen ligase family protein [Anaerolineae bacterium]